MEQNIRTRYGTIYWMQKFVRKYIVPYSNDNDKTSLVTLKNVTEIHLKVKADYYVFKKRKLHFLFDSKMVLSQKRKFPS